MGLCVDIDLLLHTYKANIVIISTSQTSVYMFNYYFWLLCMLFTRMVKATLCDLSMVIGHH